MSAAGAARFARFAHPPNALGYCGPHADGSLLQRGAGEGAGDLTPVARQFEGAWPYLALLAAAAEVDDPLHEDVVDAYWLGNRLTDRVDPVVFERDLRAAVDGRAGVAWEEVAVAIADGGRPTHAFHVFSVSPWVGLLHRGAVADALRVLDGCRIGWGRVQAVDADRALVEVEPLVLADRTVRLGAARATWLQAGVDGVALSGELSPGDRVATHWDWVCDTLTPRRLDGLRAATHQQLELVDRRLRRLGTR